MPRINTLQTNLTSGEVSPYMFGRVETTKYVNGAAEITNFFTKPQGPSVRRSGTSYKGAAIHTTNTVRVISFIFSDVQAYVLEFSDLEMRVWKNGVLEPSLNGGADNIVTPFAHGDVNALSFAQSADVLFIAHPDYPPQKISRTADDEWAIEELPIVKGPFLEENEITDEQLRIVEPTTLAQSGCTVAASTLIAEVTTPSAHGLYTGDRVVMFRDATGGSPDPPERYRIVRTATDKFTLQDDTTGDDILYSALSGTEPFTDWVWNSDTALYVGTSSLFKIGETIANSVEFKDAETSDWRLAQHVHTLWEDSAQVWGNKFDLRYKELAKGTSLGFKDHNNHDKLHSNFSGTFGYGDVGIYFRENSFFSSGADGSANWFLSTELDLDGKSANVESHKIIVNGTARLLHNIASGPGYTYPTDTVTETRSYQQNRLYYEPGIFATTDVGRPIKLRYGANIVYAKVLSVFDDVGGGVYRSAVCEFDQNVPRDTETTTQTRFNNGTTTAYALGAWHSLSTDGKLNYPAQVTFHDGRLVFAGSATQPSTVWMSVLDDFTNFAPVQDDGAVLDDNAITFTIASGRVDAIKWLSSGPTLLVGTTGGEWQISAGSSNKEALTPSSVKTSLQSGYGSVDDALPVRVGSGVLFIVRTGRQVRELAYFFNADQWDAIDLSTIAEHLLREAGTHCVQMVYQQEPNSVVYFRRSDGKVITLTYNKEQQIGAWATQDYAASTLSEVKSIAVVPSSDGTTDDVYFVMKRTIGGAPVQYIEKQEPEFFYNGLPADKLNMVFTDSHVTRNPVSNVVGTLNHLEGESVLALVNGVEEGPFTVASNQITISSGADTRTVHVGLPYTSAVKLLPLGAGSAYGNGYGKVKRVDKVSVRVKDSLKATMQFRDGNMVYWTNNGELLNREETDTADPTMFSGVYDVKPDHSYEDTDAQLVIETSGAYPLNLLWVGMELMTNE